MIKQFIDSAVLDKSIMMAPTNLLPLLLFVLPILFTAICADHTSLTSTLMFPMACSKQINTCNNPSLYHISTGLQEQQVAQFYSVNTSQFTPITHVNRQDYLINVPCSCKDINGTTAYFYDTTYTVQQNDTFDKVSSAIYSGQVWRVGGEEISFIVGDEVPIHLLCGCVESETQNVVTYTVQGNDTLSFISTLLSANVSDIESMNRQLIQNPNFIDVGSVLFVPMENNGTLVTMGG